LSFVPTISTEDVVYTLGYGARSIDEVIELLRELRIDWLVDVRSRPYSRHKPEFSKDPLEGRVRSEGIGYLFLGDAIGGMPDDRDWYVGDKLDGERYRNSDGFRAGLDRVAKGSAQGLRLCLMCSEQDPRGCHRATLIGATLAQWGIRVEHVDADGELVPQAEVCRGAQLELGL
jgi:uncharacterized protein (DUF488 family)